MSSSLFFTFVFLTPFFYFGRPASEGHPKYFFFHSFFPSQNVNTTFRRAVVKTAKALAVSGSSSVIACVLFYWYSVLCDTSLGFFSPRSVKKLIKVEPSRYAAFFISLLDPPDLPVAPPHLRTKASRRSQSKLYQCSCVQQLKSELD